MISSLMLQTEMRPMFHVGTRVLSLGHEELRKTANSSPYFGTGV